MNKIFAVALIFLCGCGQQSLRVNTQESVKIEMGTTEVWSDANRMQDWCFIGRDTNGAVWFIECKSPNSTNITGKTKIFPANK